MLPDKGLRYGLVALLFAFCFFLCGCGGAGGTFDNFWAAPPASGANSLALQGLEALNRGEFENARDAFTGALAASPADPTANLGYVLTVDMPQIYSLYGQVPGPLLLSRDNLFLDTTGMDGALMKCPKLLLGSALGQFLPSGRGREAVNPAERIRVLNRLIVYLEDSIARLDRAAGPEYVVTVQAYQCLMLHWGSSSTPDTGNFSSLRINSLNLKFLAGLHRYLVAWVLLGAAYDQSGLAGDQHYGEVDKDGDGRITLSAREDLPPPPTFTLAAPDQDTGLSGRRKVELSRTRLTEGTAQLLEVCTWIRQSLDDGTFPGLTEPGGEAVATLNRMEDYLGQVSNSLKGPTDLAYYAAPGFTVRIVLDLNSFYSHLPDDLTTWMPTRRALDSAIISWPDHTLGGTFPNGIPGSNALEQ